MGTLVDFMTLTKGIGYLVAIAFLFAFIAFWQWMHRREEGLALRVIPMTVLVLAIGGLIYSCISSRAELVTSPPTKELPLLRSAVLVKMYGPSAFGHELHQKLVGNCIFCHHYSEGRFPPCMECHGEFDPQHMERPELAHVYHLRCISCHKENQLGPTECTGCHTEAEIPPLSIAHPAMGMKDCLSCHGAGAQIPGVPEMPPDHADATNGVCQLCHRPRVEELIAIPHGIKGLGDCLMCHAEGIGEAAAIPTDHAGRTNESCTICHKPR
jgi:hypothetical protein